MAGPIPLSFSPNATAAQVADALRWVGSTHQGHLPARVTGSSGVIPVALASHYRYEHDPMDPHYVLVDPDAQLVIARPALRVNPYF